MHRNKIKNGAIFIADSHYGENRRELLSLLDKIKTGEIKTEQIFFMGDIFDLLIPPISYTKKINQELIDIIKELSKTHEVFFFEGNHDFLLTYTFLDAKVFELFAQPALFEINGKKALLMHGDRYSSMAYLTYCVFLRSYTVLYTLRLLLLDIVYPFFVKKIISALSKKKICREQSDFYSFAKAKIERISKTYNYDFLIEGHFHQGKVYDFDAKKYINIPSFACNKSFFQVEFSKSDVIFLDHQLGDSING